MQKNVHKALFFFSMLALSYTSISCAMFRSSFNGQNHGLFDALYDNDLEGVKQAINQGAHLNVRISHDSSILYRKFTPIFLLLDTFNDDHNQELLDFILTTINHDEKKEILTTTCLQLGYAEYMHPIHYAVYQNNLSGLKIIIKHMKEIGLPITRPLTINYGGRLDGFTPLQIAEHFNASQCIDYLKIIPRRKLIIAGAPNPYKKLSPSIDHIQEINDDDNFYDIEEHSKEDNKIVGTIHYYESQSTRTGSLSKNSYSPTKKQPSKHKNTHPPKKCCGLVDTCRFKNAQDRHDAVKNISSIKNQTRRNQALFTIAGESSSTCKHCLKMTELLAHKAIQDQNGQMFNYLLSCGFNNNTKILDDNIDTKKQSLLRIAIFYRSTDIIESLLESGIIITYADIKAAEKECPGSAVIIQEAYSDQSFFSNTYLKLRSWY